MRILQHFITGRGRKFQAPFETDSHGNANPEVSTPTEQDDMRIPYNHLDYEWITEGRDGRKHWLPRVEPGRVGVLLPGAIVSTQNEPSSSFSNQNGKANNDGTLVAAPSHKPFDWELDRESFASDLTEQLLSVGVVGSEVIWKAQYVELSDSSRPAYNMSASTATPRHRQAPCPIRSSLRHQSDCAMGGKAHSKKTKVTFARLSTVGVTVKQDQDVEWARVMGH